MRPPSRCAALVAVTAALATVVVPGAWSPTPTPIAHAATRYLDATFNVDAQTDIVYGSAVNVDGQTVTLLLDVYTPRGDTATNRPVFIWAHGGFFFVGSKETEKNWAIRMAQRGYVTASINYRLSPTPVTSPVVSVRDLQEINDARADMQTAVRWFRENATTLRIDPDRIAVGGSSAGAVTALGVALNNDSSPVADHPNFSSAVCTAVSFAGANLPALADAGDAGAIFHHGTADTIVPYDMAVQTRDAMVAQGLPVQFWDYAGEGHSLTDASYDIAITRTVQWLYDRVATAPYPCSAAVAARPKLAMGAVTPINGGAGVAGRSGVVSLVGVDPDAAGYLQTLPCAATPGASSNLNLDAAGQIRAALAVVPFDASGRACVFNQPRAHVVVDLQGAFAPGAFDDVADDRILDTRAGTKPAAGSQTEIRGRPGSTAVVSLVVTETTGAGYVQVLACGSNPGAASNNNADAVGQIRAVLAFVRFDVDGRACVYTQRGAHLVVDLQGYMQPGAFEDIVDARALDTRAGARPGVGSDLVVQGPPNSTAVVSLTATDVRSPGFAQFHACGSAVGGSSNLNVDAVGQTIAGLAFVRFDAQGRVCLFAQAATDLVVDIQGTMAPGAFDDIADVRLLDSRVKH
jgi:predicted esterase